MLAVMRTKCGEVVTKQGVLDIREHDVHIICIP